PRTGYYLDIFGVLWNRTIDKNIGVIENTVITPDNLAKYQFPQPLPDHYLHTCRSTLLANHRQYRIPRLNLSLWERAWTLRGMENLMMDLIADPDFAADLFTRICDYNCLVLTQAIKHLPCEGIYFGDDWGTQIGLQMSPQTWRTLIKPHLKRIYALVRDAGKYVSIHSCGKVQELFDDLIDIGVNSFNPFQPEVIDIDRATRAYKNRLCFWGGISTQATLPFATQDQVRAEVKHILDLGRSGGIIATPSHSIAPGTNPKNIIAMLETMRDFA
ncbi:MAG: hypothetical protein A2Y07_07140, partial [Planctomycetes bacterium GWF2_50_10]